MKYGIIILSFLLFNSCFAQLNKKQLKQLDKLVDDQVGKKSPGLAVGIVRNGEVVYSRHAGFADIPKEIPLSNETRFNYASSGKQFTAIAILKLIEENRINLKDDIRKYFPSFYPNIKEPILIEHLLNHSSGIRDVYDLWSLKGITWWEITLLNTDAIDLLSKQQELNFVPGSKHMYSNSNYIMLTEIIKKITEKEFVAYSKSIFDQLGMTSTSFESNHENIDTRVLPYGFWKRYREYDWNSDLHGDGALFTTLEDQLQWESIIQTREHSTLSIELISKSQAPIENSPITNYGYGLEFDEDENYSFHHGSTGAYGATFIRNPKEQLSVVVMTNYSNISTSIIAESCIDIINGKEIAKTSFPRGPEENGPFVSKEELLGTYSTPGRYFYKFIEVDNKLFLDRAGRENVEIEHEEDNIYHEINDPDFKQVFVYSEDKGLQITAYYPSHDPYTLTRLDIDMEGYDFQNLNGNYMNNELDLGFEIKHVREDVFDVKSGENVWEGQLFAPDILWANGFKMLIQRSENGDITDLMVNKGRVQNVRFSREED